MNQHNAQKQMANGSNPDSLEAILNTAADVTLGIASVFAAPVELALRRKQGTRYQHIVVLAVAQLPPLMFAALSVTAGSFLNGGGLIGAGWLCLAFTVLQWLHFFHVGKMVVNPHKEEYSKDDGVALPFWKYFPKGNTWACTRFVLEPSLVIGGALVLRVLHVITSAAAIYLVLAGIALFIKVCFLYWKAWSWLRDLLDQLGLSTRMAGGKTQGGMEAVRAAVMNAARNIPSSLPTAAIESVKGLVKETLPPELSKLISESIAVAEVENKSVEQGVLDLLDAPKVV